VGFSESLIFDKVLSDTKLQISSDDDGLNFWYMVC